jgi:cell division protease FtsH
VLTPAEQAAQNGNGHVTGATSPIGDVGAPAQR